METRPGDHERQDHIGAVFTEPTSADAAVEALHAIGLGSDHLGIAVREDDIAFEHDADAELLADTGRGAVTGGSIGAIAGLVLASVAVPGIGVGGILTLAGASTVWGGTVGAYLGTAAGERGWSAHEDLSYVGLASREVFVVACGHGAGDAVRETLRRSGGRPVDIGSTRLGAVD